MNTLEISLEDIPGWKCACPIMGLGNEWTVAKVSYALVTFLWSMAHVVARKGGVQ